ncbi:MAG: Fic family protein [Alphaproteobacteria bacterium]|nr:Fic family protein [Alphaproteobacteria bacterium]
MDLSNYNAGGCDPLYSDTFLPKLIHHEWGIADMQVLELNSRADRALGGLNAYAELKQIPDIKFFIPYVAAVEATQSSSIEGTQTTIEDAFKSSEDMLPEESADWCEVQNYIKALNSALENLKSVPFSNKLLKGAHAILMQGVRGQNKRPGDFRCSQNWIGGSSRETATFVPPPQNLVPDLMSDMEMFLHDEKNLLPPLIKIAIAHYQFETIHPFLDGNGRLGRLMIPLYLASKNLLVKPLLYLSVYFEKNKTAYIDHLMAVRHKHQMRNWLIFFLLGVEETARDSVAVFKSFLVMKERIESEILPGFSARRRGNAQKLMCRLYARPIMSINDVAQFLSTTPNTAAFLISDFVNHGILVEKTGWRRNRLFMFQEYLALFRKSSE